MKQNQSYKNKENLNKDFISVVKKYLEPHIEIKLPKKVVDENEVYFKSDRVEVRIRPHKGIFAINALYHGTIPRHLIHCNKDESKIVYRDIIYPMCDTKVDYDNMIKENVIPFLLNIIKDVVTFDLDDTEFDLFNDTLNYIKDHEYDIDLFIKSLETRIETYDKKGLAYAITTETEHDVTKRVYQYLKNI